MARIDLVPFNGHVAAGSVMRRWATVPVAKGSYRPSAVNDNLLLTAI
jgi:hypothetical protein